MPPNGVLVRLPRRSALTLKATDAPRDAPWWAKMALLVLAELEAGSASPLSAYLAELPPSFETPMHWTEAELDALQDRALVAAIAADRQQVHQLHETYATAASAELGLDPPSLKRFTWAVEAVRSRAFASDVSGDVRVLGGCIALATAGLAASSVVGSEAPLAAALLASGAVGAAQLASSLTGRGLTYAMCPVIDSMNHRSALGDATPSLGYSSLIDCFEVLAPRGGAVAGEQVFITYGQRDNDQLLTYYGFVERPNPVPPARAPTSPEECAAALAAMPTTLEHDLELRADAAAGGTIGAMPPRLALAVEWRIEWKRLLRERARACA